MSAKKTAKSRSKTKTVSAATAKKASTKKKAPSKRLVVKKLNTRTLRRILFVTIGLNLALVVAVLALMQSVYFDITIPYQTTDILTGDITTAFRHFYTFDLRWLVVALVGLASVMPLLYLTKLEKFYDKKVKAKQLWTRWLEVGVTAGLMLEGLALLVGWQDLVQLKFVWALALALAFVGYLKQKNDTTQLKVALYLTKLALVAMFGFTLINSYVFGLINNEWYVYTLYVGMIVAFLIYGKIFEKANNVSAIELERRLLFTNILTRTGFAVVIVASFLK